MVLGREEDAMAGVAEELEVLRGPEVEDASSSANRRRARGRGRLFLCKSTTNPWSRTPLPLQIGDEAGDKQDEKQQVGDCRIQPVSGGRWMDVGWSWSLPDEGNGNAQEMCIGWLVSTWACPESK